MNNGPAPDELRHAMADARAALTRDAHAAGRDARTLVDWRHHFRNHPWVYCGSAAAIGFLLVPQRKSMSQVAATAPVANGSESPRAKSLAATLLEIGGALVARQSLKYVTQRGLDWLELRTATRSASEQPAPSDERVRK